MRVNLGGRHLSISLQSSVVQVAWLFIRDSGGIRCRTQYRLAVGVQFTTLLLYYVLLLYPRYFMKVIYAKCEIMLP